MPRSGFYLVTRRALAGVTDLYDFAWPTTAAIWTLRTQIKGYLAEFPSATEKQLKARFGMPVGSSSNYQNFGNGFGAVDWPEHEARLAAFLLMTLVAEYEAWTHAILVAATDSEKFAERHEKGLQIPTSGNDGVFPTIAKAVPKTSTALVNAFQPVLVANPRYAGGTLDNLMVAFRYYKEIRNALAHGGGVATQRVLEAAAKYSPLSTSVALGMKHPPLCGTHLKGQPLTLSLRQVVGFGDLMLRLLVTIDAHLSKSIHGETELTQRWLDWRGPTPLMLPADGKKRISRVVNGIERSGLPRPIACADLPSLLKARGLAFF